MVIGMEQLKIARLVGILLYWSNLICWPTNRFIGQTAVRRVDRNSSLTGKYLLSLDHVSEPRGGDT